MNANDLELDVICNRLADGLATEADERRLGELLRGSAAARQAYRQFMALHAALHWDYVAAVAPAGAANSTADAPAKASRLNWVAAFAAGAIAACLVVAAVLYFSGSHADQPVTVPSTAARNAPGDSAPHAAAIAALLVDEVGAQFAPDRSPDGVRFGPGEYELLKGVVHLRFAQGADMVLSAPARLTVTGAQHARLDFGMVRVTAPPSAKGFTITTAAADFVDLGTEFGLSVDAGSGAADLYVFDGQVNVTDPKSGRVLSQVLGGGSLRQVDGVKSAAPQLRDDDFPTPDAIGFRRWREHEERMAQAPGVLAYFPFRKQADESVLANSHHDRLVPAGSIVGARWASGRWPGKDALLFDRDGDHALIDIPGEFEELSIAAWIKIDRLDFVLNAILNSDGYDRGDIHFQLNRQGFPRGGVVLEGGFEDKVVGSAVPVGAWTHVASVISTRTRSQEIYVNGVLARQRRWTQDEVLRPGSCRVGNWLATATDRFPERALRGRIDELTIWNRALPPQEVRQLMETGWPRSLQSE